MVEPQWFVFVVVIVAIVVAVAVVVACVVIVVVAVFFLILRDISVRELSWLDGSCQQMFLNHLAPYKCHLLGAEMMSLEYSC